MVAYLIVSLICTAVAQMIEISEGKKEAIEFKVMAFVLKKGLLLSGGIYGFAIATIAGFALKAVAKRFF